MTYVYFLADERTASAGFALVKIGRSDSPDVRASQLQTGNGHPLRLLGWVPASDDTERQLHDAFAPFRVRGEWFRVYPAGLELIESVCEEAERRALTEILEASLSIVIDTRQE